MISDEKIRSYILKKLARKGKWGGAHISFDKIARWIRPRELGKNGKRVKRVLVDLIKEGLV